MFFRKAAKERGRKEIIEKDFLKQHINKKALRKFGGLSCFTNP
jgi:hypothetical protein